MKGSETRQKGHRALQEAKAVQAAPGRQIRFVPTADLVYLTLIHKSGRGDSHNLEPVIFLRVTLIKKPLKFSGPDVFVQLSSLGYFFLGGGGGTASHIPNRIYKKYRCI